LGGAIVPTANTFVEFRAVNAKDIRDANPRAATDDVKVAVVEDDERLRQALVFQLGSASFQVAPYSSAEEFLNVPDASAFDCIVADLILPRMNGLQLQEELNRLVPFASIVFITGHGDLSLGMQAMREGAVDFLEKPVDEEALLTSITRGAKLSRARRAEQLHRIGLEKRHRTLTPREREVFALITTGLLNKQVGAELGATERTIKVHRGRVMNKMRANSLADLVNMAGTLQIHARHQNG
jgi:FixJ family two-component response regulator